MKHVTTLGAALLALTVTGAAFALPLKVRTAGTKAQHVIMCPDCKSKVACATAGDYTIGLSVDLEGPKVGTGRLVVHVQDKTKAPVTGAAVVATVSMPEHKSAGKRITLKHDRHGRYLGSTNAMGHTGAYRLEVAVTPAGGDTVNQVFTFRR